MSLYSKEYSCSWDESEEEEKEAWEVLFITQETQNDHKNLDIDGIGSKGECTNDLIERQNKTRMKQDNFWGTKDDKESEQEDLE